MWVTTFGVNVCREQVDRSRAYIVIEVVVPVTLLELIRHCYLVALKGKIITTYSSRVVDRSGGTFVRVLPKMRHERSTTCDCL